MDEIAGLEPAAGEISAQVVSKLVDLKYFISMVFSIEIFTN